MHLIQNYIENVPSMISKAASIGGTGVHIFIFCSGFGLYLSWLRNPKSYKDFFLRRFLKVYIPYIIVVTVSALLPYMYSENDRIAAYLSHVFLFKMFVPRYEESFGGQLWFVSTIIQFYFIFIPLCRVRKRIINTKFVFMFGLIISFIWWVFICFMGIYNLRIFSSFFLQYFWEFVLGMCIAEYLENKNDLIFKVKYLTIVCILGIGIEGIMAFKGNIFRVFNDIPAFIGYASFAILVFKYCGNMIRNWIMIISRISYEWYLVHTVVFSTMYVLFGGQIIIAVTALIISIGIAVGYSAIIKKYTKKFVMLAQIKWNHHI